MGNEQSTASAVRSVRGPAGGPIAVTVNGSSYAIKMEPRVSLLDATPPHIAKQQVIAVEDNPAQPKSHQ